MPTPSDPVSAAAPGAELEAALALVELSLAALGDALREHDAQAIESRASELHRALAQAVHRFAHAARSGGVPPSLRSRLALASGRVAAQRESLARATAALDRAIDVLMPRENGAVYSAQGGTERTTVSGGLQA